MPMMMFLEAVMMIGATAIIPPTATFNEQAHTGGSVLFSFDPSASEGRWFNVNNSVMGGVSIGNWDVSPNRILAFHGTLSLENNGGFATVRSRGPSLNLSTYFELPTSSAVSPP
jgi:hypothetical protein